MPSDPTYTVRRISQPTTKGNIHYEITKFPDGASEPSDQYDVIIPGRSQDSVYCNCMGFRRQTYAKELHKHVLLVELFRKLGEPIGQLFAIDSVGNPRVVGKVLDAGLIKDHLQFDPSD